MSARNLSLVFSGDSHLERKTPPRTDRGRGGTVKSKRQSRLRLSRRSESVEAELRAPATATGAEAIATVGIHAGKSHAGLGDVTIRQVADAGGRNGGVIAPAALVIERQPLLYEDSVVDEAAAPGYAL